MPSASLLFLQADRTSWLYVSPQAVHKQLITSSLSLSIRLSSWVQRSLIEGMVVSMMMGFSLFICISPLAFCCIGEFNDILGFPMKRCVPVPFSLSTVLQCVCRAFFSFFCSLHVGTWLVGFLGFVGQSIFLVCPCSSVHVSFFFL